MHDRTAARFVIGCFLLAFVLHPLIHAQVTYNVVPFPGRVGDASASNQSINNRGSVIGTSRVNPQQRGFFWKNNHLGFLPALGGTCSHAAGISDIDHIVGYACLAGDTVTHASLWKPGSVTDIDTFGGTGSAALRINRFDDAAGYFFALDGTIHAFFWSNGSWSDLGNLGGSFTDAFAINNKKLVGGQSDISNTPDSRFGIPPSHSFLWQAGVLTDLGSIFGTDFSYVNAIDQNGVVVGTSDLAGDLVAHAYIWKGGVITDLQTLPGYDVSWAGGMNNREQVVGLAGFRDPVQSDGPPDEIVDCPCAAILWQNGQILDLNTLVPPQWSLSDAVDINDSGEIVAFASSPIAGPVLLVPANSAPPVSSIKPAHPLKPYTGPRGFRRDQYGAITANW
jgi:probable HAF family extracellular repeat protein